MENTKRSFHVLEQLHVLPNISYLAKVRNTEEIDKNWGEEDHGEGGHAAEGGHKAEGHKPDSTLPSTPKTEEAHH